VERRSLLPLFKGRVESRIDEGEGVVTDGEREDVRVLGGLRIVAGLYDTKGKQGVYHGVLISEVNRIIAIGNPPSA
jgi:hypothetical protein